MNRKKLYALEEILFLTICSSICGLNEWDEIVDFGHMRLDWLREYFSYKNGIPSHDTLNRVFSLLDHESFCTFFNAWVKDWVGEKIQGGINIDGKALRGTAPRQKNAKKLLHTINAWSTEQGVSFGQTEVMGKGNELEGIRQLLNLIDLTDCTVSIDAIGCQKDIAKQIQGAGGDYILAVKGNQAELEAEITNAFKKIDVQDQYEHTTYTGGRVETRHCAVIHQLGTFVDEAQHWEGAQTVIQMTTQRYVKTTCKTTLETRFFISSRKTNAETFCQLIKEHWQVENNLHWHLDVTMGEDADRKRRFKSAVNFSIVRKIALNLISKHPDKVSLHRKQNKALMDVDYLLKVLF